LGLKVLAERSEWVRKWRARNQEGRERELGKEEGEFFCHSHMKGWTRILRILRARMYLAVVALMCGSHECRDWFDLINL